VSGLTPKAASSIKFETSIDNLGKGELDIFDAEFVLGKPGEHISTSSVLSGNTIPDEEGIAKGERANKRYHPFVRG